MGKPRVSTRITLLIWLLGGPFLMALAGAIARRYREAQWSRALELAARVNGAPRPG